MRAKCWSCMDLGRAACRILVFARFWACPMRHPLRSSGQVLHRVHQPSTRCLGVPVAWRGALLRWPFTSPQVQQARSSSASNSPQANETAPMSMGRHAVPCLAHPFALQGLQKATRTSARSGSGSPHSSLTHTHVLCSPGRATGAVYAQPKPQVPLLQLNRLACWVCCAHKTTCRSCTHPSKDLRSVLTT